jgi:hypothetical protein
MEMWLLLRSRKKKENRKEQKLKSQVFDENAQMRAELERNRVSLTTAEADAEQYKLEVEELRLRHQEDVRRAEALQLTIRDVVSTTDVARSALLKEVSLP